MDFDNHKSVVRCSILALLTLCYLLPNEFANARTFATRRHSLELAKRKGTIKSIEGENGEVIDCVDIYKQPAFDHPLLKNHIIEYAEVTLIGGKYYGANATINLWTPVTYYSEFSLAQLWLVSGRQENVNTIEAGWMVDSGSKQTKLFIYWTADNYKITGCYNLECPGFVQVNGQHALGASVEPVSSYDGDQFDVVITVFKNKESGHWWLQIQDQAIGYWPDSIFTTIKDGAEIISWGGEIINNGLEGHHTRTQMGSGHFPSEGYKKAAFFRNIQYVDDAGIFKDPEYLIPYASKPSCYSFEVGEDTSTDKGTFFYFGGPGYSESCPN
ncbi:hypothetical protein TorRG33x02_244960 [Trema orientale]|uniref:Neprosin PEP catalytic domain-containing protein n=1 Tax=Trema orientale TaxID=63057 RepID=A0A2P5DQT5_TREOI|nr:hypothetical protein TorRG33x02_244960 [Trema orientale]